MVDGRRAGWGLAALGMLLVSTDSLFVRLSEAEALDIAFLVAMCALPVFVLLNRRFETTGFRASLRRETRPLLAIAALSAVSQLAFITAVTRTDVANVVAIVAATPVVAAVIARFALGERTSRRVSAAIAVTGVGIALIVGGSLGRPTLDGDLFAVLATVAFAVNIVVWRHHPDLSRYVGLALSSMLVLALLAPFVDPLSQAPRAYAAVAAMGLLFSPAGRIAHSSAPRFAPAAEVALFAPVETVAATIWAWLAFSEVPTPSTVLGAVVIIAGLFFGTFGSRRLRPRSMSQT